MVTHKEASKDRSKTKVKADVIILGCTLPGIVAAHKLKKRFGDSMDIVVLDLAHQPRNQSKCSVTFQRDADERDASDASDDEPSDKSAKLIDNVARYYLVKYSAEWNLPLPEAIIAPQRMNQKLNKLFQHINGTTVECSRNYHDFNYLSFVERFELNQYQSALDQSMRDLFLANKMDTGDERKTLMFYDRTTMERHICAALLFSTSREIMRMTVRIVCGAPPNSVSVLFYLHQCFRTSSSRNHLDGSNTRCREKLMGYFRKRLAIRLQQSVADITYVSIPIQRIKTRSDERVVLETIKGETTYICNLLAMALKPDELTNINVEDHLLSNENLKALTRMRPGRAKKFLVQYTSNFWEKQGYSGDILSVRGPIIWAMERPKMSNTGSVERYSCLVGYLMDDEDDSAITSRVKVLEQLVKLFGEEAADPVSYKETSISDIFIPKCGDYVALRRLAGRRLSPKYVEWGAMDVFEDGDVAAALEAGHTAYLHLLSCLRPQAQTFEDLSTSELPTRLDGDFFLHRWIPHVNIINSIRWGGYVAAAVVAAGVLRTAFKRK